MVDLSFDDRDGFIWMDGEMLPWREAKLHVLTHGLHYGSSVFEGQRAYGGTVFRLREHSMRLVRSARLLDFEIPYTVEEIDKAAIAVLEANKLKDAYLRPVAWRGSENMSVAAPSSRIHLAVAAWDWPSYWPLEKRMAGLRLTFADWRRPDPRTAPSASKAAGLYMICTMAKNKAAREGFDDALMLDYKGRVAEATGANIFFVKGQEIHTPTTECVLEGITRLTAMELAERRGWRVRVREIQPDEMGTFDEAFLTGTAAEIAPVSAIGPYRFTPGEVCKTLMTDYDNLVRGRRLD